MTSTQTDIAARLTPVQWAICVTAAIGFAFDSYVLLMLPLIVRPALMELLRVGPADPRINQWVGYLFYWPAVAGGIFGLLGGYLTDLFGRRRVLVWSILLYAIAGLAAGYSTTVRELLFWRCCMFVGVCVEFVAAVAWLAELFSNPKQREAVVGYTQAFGSLGGVMVTGAYYLVVTYADHLPLVRGGHEAWRYTLMSGLVPAIPLIVIRPFLPESPAWREKKKAGTLRRPSFGELFRPQFSRTTVVTTIMMACAFAAAFGAIQQVPRIVPGLAEVRVLPKAAQEQTAAAVQSFQEFGGLIGRIVLAFLAVRIVSRRRLLHIFQIPGLILLPLVFLFPATSSLSLLRWGIFFVGLLTIAQFSYWGNYLPRVYPTYLRGTGESFAANVGGRMLGTSAALVTTNLVASMPGATAPIRLAHAAAVVGTAAYVIGFAASFWLPEPTQEQLPE
ncbi:MAG TPA: MFS transporter [Vicinamibacterales bacterium]|jgi:MFS family permease|nr:MFS transporter [Vicinamibacterales bacterium]